MSFPFLSSLERLPLCASPARSELGFRLWQEALESLSNEETLNEAEALADDPKGRPLLAAIFANSPFLTDALLADIAFFIDLVRDGPERSFTRQVENLTLLPGTREEVARGLRQARRRIALTIALADIASCWKLEQVTESLSAFADAALSAGLSHLLQAAVERGEIAGLSTEAPLADCGYVVLAMGKYGARELNYSSDIDLIALYDPQRIDYRGLRGLQDGMVRLTRDLCRLLDERTADGYVFRTDLRLRPDPGATPLAISYNGALLYYESAGQNWERAAMIKARPAAGDLALGEAFLKEITPFVWRKHLDFWAIQDVHSIKRQIQAERGGAAIAVEGHNIKLGRGGIREIEFFCQTQQLIFGGRHPELRSPRTLEALRSLEAAERISRESARDLAAAYRFLRQLEHRLQMVADQQTHSLPDSAAEIAEIAAFLGFESESRFRRALLDHLGRVERHYAELFEEAPSLAGPGNLVFTGGEPEPATLATLAEMGFRNGRQVFALVSAWHHGRYRAMRSTRARELLTELVPTLLAEVAKTRDPDGALLRFDAFLAGLPAGVQLFSLLYQNPGLLEMLAEIMGRAAALADWLGRRPALLEAVLEPGFFEPLPDAEALAEELARQLSAARDFQDVLEETRRWANDRKFQVGVQILRNMAGLEETGRALADIADVVIRGLQEPVTEELARQHGRLPEPGLAVLTLGKLGAREMTPGSDLDLVFLYEAPEEVESDGPKPVPPSLYYERLAQRFITALSAPTGEGKLYEVDPRLRPSGRKGLIATSLAGFARYQREEAWTWEHMTLTRARVVSGRPDFTERIMGTVREVLRRPRDPEKLLRDVAEMRRRIAQSYPGRSPWDVKYVRGGLYDIDFIAQYLQLRHGAERPDVFSPSSVEALARLAAAGAISQEAAEALMRAHQLWRELQGYLRLTVGERFDPQEATEGLKAALARAAGFPDFPALEAGLAAAREDAARLYEEIIEGPAAALPALKDDPPRK